MNSEKNALIFVLIVLLLVCIVVTFIPSYSLCVTGTSSCEAFWIFKELVQVVLSWPVAISFILLALFIKFPDSWGNFIENMILKYKGVEISSSKQPKADSETKRVKESREETNLIGEELDLDKGALSEELQEKFNYFDLFLVPNSKAILRSFASFGELGMKTELFISRYTLAKPITGDELKEKKKIVSVLIGLGLLEEVAGIARISGIGSKYIQYIDKKLIDYMKQDFKSKGNYN